jgi:hypothetical protein
MRKALVATLSVLAPLVFTSGAQALDLHLAQRYEASYHAVAHRFGPRAPGRNIVRWGTVAHRRPTDAQVRASLAVLDRMLHPVVFRPRPVGVVHSYRPTAVPTYGESALVRCIVARESGGRPYVVNASGHMGLGQWDEATWIAQGGLRFGRTPLQASPGAQLWVIENAVAHGQARAWTPYDDC